LQLAPHNRHVLRSASRYYLAKDVDKAHDLIRLNEATPNDPWLLAAEIAIAELCDRTSRFAKRGLNLLDGGNYLPRQITELAGALGSKLLIDGNRRRGRKLLRQSLIDPTGNSLAQAEWLAQNLKEHVSTEEASPLKEECLRISNDATEALALHLYNAGKFEESLDYVRLWIVEEPSSVRAFKAASGVANTVGHFQEAMDFAANGLRLDPDCAALLNGMAFSLASQNRLIEAEKFLKKVDLDGADKVQVQIAKANWGLIAFRAGRPNQGAELYRDTIDSFRRLGVARLERLAKVFFAREAIRAGLSDALEILAEVVPKETVLGGSIPL
jgi:Tfp pilus assembly protein PilF